MGPAHGTVMGGSRAATDHQRNGPLERTRVGIDAAEIGEAAMKIRMVVIPEVIDGQEVLVSRRSSLLIVGADGAELRLQIADADPEV